MAPTYENGQSYARVNCAGDAEEARGGEPPCLQDLRQTVPHPGEDVQYTVALRNGALIFSPPTCSLSDNTHGWS